MKIRTSPLKTLLPRGRSLAMCGYCPWPGREFCAGPGVGGGAAGGIDVVESTGPDIGPLADANKKSPRTMRTNGEEFQKSKKAQQVSCNKDNRTIVNNNAHPNEP